MKRNILIASTAIILLLVAMRLVNSDVNGTKNLDGFARCLAEKGWTMYGAYWCPHCQNEKEHFGDAWRYVRYVECAEDPKRCVDAGVEGFPTWIGPEDRRAEGEQGINGLAALSGCTY